MKYISARNVPTGTKTSVAEASKAMNIGTRSTNRALKIEKQGSESLKQAVKSESISLAKAAQIADEPKQTQTKLVTGTIKPPKDLTAISNATLQHIIKISDKLIRDDWQKLALICADKLA